jgi:hypothetical protein
MLSQRLLLSIASLEIVIGGAFLMLVILISAAVETPHPMGSAIVWSVALAGLLIPFASAFAVTQRGRVQRMLGVVGLTVLPLSVFAYLA